MAKTIHQPAVRCRVRLQPAGADDAAGDALDPALRSRRRGGHHGAALLHQPRAHRAAGLRRHAAARTSCRPRIRSGHAHMLKQTEEAMSLSLKGDPQAAVIKLLNDGSRRSTPRSSSRPTWCCSATRRASPTTKNCKRSPAQAMRERYRTTDIHAGLGELGEAHTGRAAGGMSLSSRLQAAPEERRPAGQRERCGGLTIRRSGGAWGPRWPPAGACSSPAFLSPAHGRSPRRAPSPRTGRPVPPRSRSTAPPARWPCCRGRPACG